MENFNLSDHVSADDIKNVSDSFHSFSELYESRMLYNALLFNEWSSEDKYKVSKSRKHNTGELCYEGKYFIVVAKLPTGQISNHYEIEHWELFQVPELNKSPRWDGHTSQDVTDRIKKFLLSKIFMEDLSVPDYPKKNPDYIVWIKN